MAHDLSSHGRSSGGPAVSAQGTSSLGRHLIPFAAWLAIRLLRASMRIRHVGREALEGLEERRQNYILAFWHGRLLMMPYCYRRRKMAILISEHGDGELIARTMGWFGHRSIRGSSTRGGASALRQAIRRLREGWDIGFTPDGPQGPRFCVQAGVIQAARLGRVPVIPVSFSARPARRLGSWDRFLLPWPFSRGVFLYGRPLSVPPDADAAQMEAARRELEERLRRLTAQADGVSSPSDGAAGSLTSA